MPEPRPALRKLLRDNLLAALDDALAVARTANRQAPSADAGFLVRELERTRSFAEEGLYVEEQA